MADRLLDNPPLMEETRLRVSRLGAPDRPTNRTIEVTGLTPSITNQILQRFFSKKKRSGGGPIENIDFDESDDKARITFHSQEGRCMAYFEWFKVTRLYQ